MIISELIDDFAVTIIHKANQSNWTDLAKQNW